jgi:uncharacterized membrane protein YdbT with pleckstrin-like domain
MAQFTEVLWQASGTWLGIPVFERYTLYADRLMINKGFLSIKEDETALHRILDISLQQGIMDRILGFGTLALTARDDSHPLLLLRGVRRPRQARDQLRGAVAAARSRLGIEGREMTGSADEWNR